MYVTAGIKLTMVPFGLRVVKEFVKLTPSELTSTTYFVFAGLPFAVQRRETAVDPMALAERVAGEFANVMVDPINVKELQPPPSQAVTKV